MDSSSSSSLFDASLHEDIDDLLFPGLDFDEETLDFVNEFAKDLDLDNGSNNNDNDNNININDNNINNDNNDDYDFDNSTLTYPHSPEYLAFDQIHSPHLPVSSPSSAPNLDIPLSPLNDQPSQSQNSDSLVPPLSDSSNLNVPLEPLQQPQSSQSFHQYPIPVQPQTHQSNVLPNHSLSQYQSHCDPNLPNHVLSTTNDYWNSNIGATEFFNYDNFNNTGNSPAIAQSQVNTVCNNQRPVLNKSSSISQPTINANDASGSAERGQYKKVKKGQSSQKGRFFPAVLPIDNSHSTTLNGGKSQFWFFVLQLLMDPSHKSTIAWTGHQRFFRVIDRNAFCTLWLRYTGNDSSVENAIKYWKTAERNIRAAGEKGIMMPVPSKTHKGQNDKEGVVGFMIEPSYYVGMTREELDRFIVENCETVPLPPPQVIAPSNAPTPVMHNHQQHQQHHQQFPLGQQYPNFPPQIAQPMNENAPLQQPQALAPSTSSAPVTHNQLPHLQQQPQQAQFHQQQFHFQPHMVQPVNEFPYYPNFQYYQQQPPVMHSQYQPTNYRYSPY